MELGILALLSARPVIVTGETSDSNRSEANLAGGELFREIMGQPGMATAAPVQPILPSTAMDAALMTPTLLLSVLSVSEPLAVNTDTLVQWPEELAEWPETAIFEVLPPEATPISLGTIAPFITETNEIDATAENAPLIVWSSGLSVTEIEAEIDVLRAEATPSERLMLVLTPRPATNTELKEWLADSADTPSLLGRISIPLDASLEESIAVLQQQWQAQMAETAAPDAQELSQEASPLVGFAPLRAQLDWLSPLAEGMEGADIRLIRFSTQGTTQSAAPLISERPVLPAATLSPNLSEDGLSNLSDDELARLMPELEARLQALTGSSTQQTGRSPMAAPAQNFADMLAQQSANGLRFEGQPDALFENLPQQTGDVTLPTTASSTASEAIINRQNETNRPFSLQLLPPDARPEAAEQVHIAIRQALKGGTDRITIQLDPAELGRVDVKIEIGSDGRASLFIAADQRGTLDALQRDARQLIEALQQAGIDADGSAMQFSLKQGNPEREGREPFASLQAGAENEVGTEDALLSENEFEYSAEGSISLVAGLNIKV